MSGGLALAIALVSRGFARLWHVPKAWARISPGCGAVANIVRMVNRQSHPLSPVILFSLVPR